MHQAMHTQQGGQGRKQRANGEISVVDQMRRPEPELGQRPGGQVEMGIFRKREGQVLEMD